jgi:competence ComEA-like helix-hairpin-helix protein
MKLHSSPEKTNIPTFIKVMDSLAQPDQIDNEKLVKSFKFNPNTASVETLSELGLPEKTIKTIEKYRSKGGTFKSKEDFKKIYNLNPDDFARLEPYIDLTSKKQLLSQATFNTKNIIEPKSIAPQSLDPNELDSTQIRLLGFKSSVAARWVKYVEKGGVFKKEEDLLKVFGIDTNRLMNLKHIWKFKENQVHEEKAVVSPKVRKSEMIKLDINSASDAEWQYLSGIGEKLSQRIVKYRSQLGGFINIEQVSETFGLPDSTFQSIKPFLILESKAVQIKINCADKSELALHPYISYKQAELLCNYRSHHGSYKSSDDLYKLKILQPDWIHKISPYFDFTHCEIVEKTTK